MMKFICVVFITILLSNHAYCDQSQDASKIKHRIKVQTTHKIRGLAKIQEEKGQLDNEKVVLKDKQIKGGTDEKMTHRYTEDDRICSDKFVFEGKVYTDCSLDKTPDNKQEKKEWCYVRKDQGKGQNGFNWGYCKAIIDYDVVRQKVTQILKEMILRIRQVTAAVSAEIKPTQKSIDTLVQIEKDQEIINAKLQICLSTIPIIQQNYEYLIANKYTWELLNAELEKQAQSIEELKVIIAAKGRDPTDCTGYPGYESETPGDGIKGYYYDNEAFQGSFKTRIDETINMDYINESPMEEINFENYSVKWQGYLRIPKSGKYVFYGNSDDGLQMSLNGQVILQNQAAKDVRLGRGKTFLGGSDDMLKQNFNIENYKEIDDTQEAKSSPVNLIGGNKYVISYKYFHSVHNEQTETGKAYAYLKWSSEDMESSFIDQSYWYTKSSRPPAKIFDYDANLFDLSNLIKNEACFFESNEYKVQDIPQTYSKMPSIKVKRNYNKPNIQFTTNDPLILYAAVENPNKSKTVNPFEKFTETGDVLSVLKANDKGKVHKLGFEEKFSIIYGSESVRYKIFKRNIPSGKQDIKVTYTGASSVNFFLFYIVDPQSKQESSCGGDQDPITKQSQYFSSCRTSNKLDGEGNDCNAAFSGDISGAASSGNEWRVPGGIGEFIDIKLNKENLLSKFDYYQRESEQNMITRIKVTFGPKNVDPEYFNLKTIVGKQTYEFGDPSRRLQMRFTIEAVRGGGQPGGRFVIYGTPCVSLDDPSISDQQLPQLSNAVVRDPKKITKLTCQDSLITNINLSNMELSPGDVVNVRCKDACGMQDNLKVYGDKIYSSDSSICRAAVHAGAIKNELNQKFSLNVVDCPMQFKSNSKQGDAIITLSKGGCDDPNDLAITFGADKSATPIIKYLREGNQVDIQDGDKWLEGIVQNIQPIRSDLMIVTVRANGKSLKASWPSATVTFCGVKLRDRKCSEESKDPDSAGGDIRINFGSKAVDGWDLDMGEIYGKKGNQEYGWVTNNQKRVRTRKSNGDQLLDQLILFNPDKKSKWCEPEDDASGEQIDCQDAVWKIKMKPGLYNVIVTYGDSEISAKYDLIVNGRPVAGEFLLENQYVTKKIDTVDAMNGYIELSAFCSAKEKEACKYSYTRISAIDITRALPPPPPKTPKQIQDSTIQLGCGESRQFGLCEESDNTTNCIYENFHSKGVDKCGGQNKLYRVSSTNQCIGQRTKLKCASPIYANKDDCLSQCPGHCTAGKGVGSTEYSCAAKEAVIVPKPVTDASTVQK